MESENGNGMQSLTDVAAALGMTLPNALTTLIDAGSTEYGENWKNDWRERCLKTPPALASTYDFEWLTPTDSLEVATKWLNPLYQQHRLFFPFAQSGAGDCYCLTSLQNGQLGVSLVWHDAAESSVEYSSFSDFVCARFLETFADMAHLTDEDFSDAEAHQCLVQDVQRTAALMAPAVTDYLLSFLNTEPAYRAYKDGPKAAPRNTLSLISEAQLSTELRKFAANVEPAFAIKSRWDI